MHLPAVVSEQALVLVGLVLGKMMLSQLSILLSKDVFKFSFCLLWCPQSAGCLLLISLPCFLLCVSLSVSLAVLL